MLPGMTAKALIRIEGVDNALLIPEKALRQTGRSAGLRSKPAMHLHWDIAIPNFIAFLHDEHVTHL